MRKLMLVLVAVVCLGLMGCAAKTKSELIEKAKLRAEFTVDKNYQDVYRGIAEKFSECTDTYRDMKQELYYDIRRGEFYLNGAFLTEVIYINTDKTRVNIYSILDLGHFNTLMQLPLMGAYEKQGCP